jgi:hypothetical protein
MASSEKEEKRDPYTVEIERKESGILLRYMF